MRIARTLPWIFAAAASAAAASPSRPVREALPFIEDDYPAALANEVLPFIENDFAKAIARAEKKKEPIFVDAWAPW